MRTFSALVERDADGRLFVGYVPGWPGAHSQGQSLDELRANLQEVVSMLLEDGEPTLESERLEDPDSPLGVVPVSVANAHKPAMIVFSLTNTGAAGRQ